MTAMRRLSVLVPAVLLAAATAAADTAITAEEVIPCSVELADPSFLSLRLPQGGSRILNTRDVYEVRIPDSNRFVEIAAQVPQLKVTLDSGQAVPTRAVRAREMLRLRLQRAREAQAKGFPGYAEVVGPLRGTSASEMVAKCSDMDFVLRERVRSDEAVAGLLREVSREEETLRRLWLRWTTCLYAPCGGLLGMAIGGLLAFAMDPFLGDPAPPGGSHASGPYIALVGCSAAGLVTGAAVGAARNRSILAGHRDLVSDLIRRVNLAVVTAP